MLKRILIVDDEPAIRDMVAFALRKGEYEPVHAGDALEAQTAIADRVPDLILLDWMLPGSSGLELAAARRGWVEQLTLRLADFSLAFPALLTAILLSAVRGPGLGNAVLAIALLNIPIFARLARASAASVWAQNYVLAARACGKSRWRITWEHILPHCAGVLMAQASSQFALAILAEAALSYLGLGVQAPTPSWGRMLSEAQSLLYQAPQLALYPGLAIALAVLGFQLVGEGLRQLLAPPTQGRSPW